MAYKTVELQREANRRNYHNDKAKNKLRIAAYKQSLKGFVKGLKEKTPCSDCNINYPSYVMDFDHIGDNKVMDVSRLAAQGFKSQLLIEIKKCQIVCANCHRIRTYERSHNVFL
jgi:hypothetical protein